MFVRTVTFTGATDIDAGLRYLQDTVVPLLREQTGFRGVTASTDRSGAVLGVLSLWETEADRDASEAPLGKVRQEALGMIGGEVTVELYEELMAGMQRTPEVGQSLLLRYITMSPEKIDENIDYFRREVAPQIMSSPGFCAIRNLINRQTGKGVVGMVWADRDAMEAAARENEVRRQEAAERGVTFGELGKREIVLIELR